MIGIVLSVLAVLAAAILAIPAVSPSGQETWISLTASSMAFTCMGVNLLLAARFKLIEPLFGGLDRVYRVHKYLGISVIGLLLIHYFIKPNFEGLKLGARADELAFNIGTYAFYAILILLTLSWIKRLPRVPYEIPYGWWRWTHRTIGIFFSMAAFHQLFIKRPFEGSAPLASYLNIWAFIGILCYLYVEFAPFLKRRRYRLSAVERHPGATLLEAKPLGWKTRAHPGQFAFIKFRVKGLGEPHPFTIAGRDEDGTLRFAIRPLGDFTKRLRAELQVGDTMVVEGGYGHFRHHRGGRRQIWLAGGVGITPFLAWVNDLPKTEGRRYHLIHAVRKPDEAIGKELFEKAASQRQDFSYTLHASEGDNRLTAEKIIGYLPFDPAGADLWFCGPAPLRQAIKAGLRKAGVRLARLEFEQFEFR